MAPATTPVQEESVGFCERETEGRGRGAERAGRRAHGGCDGVQRRRRGEPASRLAWHGAQPESVALDRVLEWRVPYLWDRGYELLGTRTASRRKAHHAPAAATSVAPRAGLGIDDATGQETHGKPDRESPEERLEDAAAGAAVGSLHRTVLRVLDRWDGNGGVRRRSHRSG